MKEKIWFEEHALYRLMLRSLEFGIDFERAKLFAIQTVSRGTPARKHKSHKHKTHCCYFDGDYNVTFYVVFDDKLRLSERVVRIKTVIIESGRE
jgi:hypothetical protein